MLTSLISYVPLVASAPTARIAGTVYGGVADEAPVTVVKDIGFARPRKAGASARS